MSAEAPPAQTWPEEIAADARGELNDADPVELLIAIEAVLRPRARFQIRARDKVEAIEILLRGAKSATWPPRSEVVGE